MGWGGEGEKKRGLRVEELRVAYSWTAVLSTGEFYMYHQGARICIYIQHTLGLFYFVLIGGEESEVARWVR